MCIKQLHLHIQIRKLRNINRPILKHPIMNQCPPLRRRRNHRKERQIINIQPRKRHRMNLICRRLEPRLLQLQIHQPRPPIPRHILLAPRNLRPHIFQHLQLHLQKLNRRPQKLNLTLRHQPRRNQTHRLNRVFARTILHLHINLRHPHHSQRRRPHPFNLHP